MTSTEKSIEMVIAELKLKPRTCTEVGTLLYGKEHRKCQAYARPGGRILHMMKRLGLVEQYYDGRHFFLWKLTAKGKARAKAQPEKQADKHQEDSILPPEWPYC